jgi:hypothetical protein
MNQVSQTQPTLSQLIREAMSRQSISGNMLAQAAGVSEGTIRNLLRENTDPDATGPQALVLKAVCSVLGLDEIRIFQAAGFLNPDRLTPHISANAEYLAVRFDRLPPDKQELLMGMVESLEKLSGIDSPGSVARDLLEAVRELRQTHPMYQEHRLAITDRLGRFFGGALGKLTNQTVEDLALNSVVAQLQTLYSDDPAHTAIDSELVLSAVNHPHAAIALNALLPKKTIPSNVEKLFWLIYPASESPSTEQQEAVKDLWELLVRTSAVKKHNNTK